jgi:hypothetical protein
MAVRKKDESKVVVKLAAGTYLDVRKVLKHEGMGKQRKVKSTEYGIFHYKHRVSNEKYNSPEKAVAFIAENFAKYDKKSKSFK